MAGSILGFSLPTFWVGLMLIMVFSVMLGWLPSNGRGPTTLLFGSSRCPSCRVEGCEAPDPAGDQPRAVQDRAADPPDARRRARGAAAGLRQVRARQGPVQRARDRRARAAQHPDPDRHRDRARVRLGDRVRHRHRERVRLAGHGQAADRLDQRARPAGDRRLPDGHRVRCSSSSTWSSTCSTRRSTRACGSRRRKG